MDRVQEAEPERRGQGGTAPPLDFQAQYKAHMAKLGAKGGKVSGAKRMTNLTEAERKRIAKKAADARWTNRKKDV